MSKDITRYVMENIVPLLKYIQDPDKYIKQRADELEIYDELTKDDYDKWAKGRATTILEALQEAKRVCPFCGTEVVKSDIPEDIAEDAMCCPGGCWIDGTSIPKDKWPIKK